MVSVQIQTDKVRQAVALHQTGKLAEAVREYEKLLVLMPDNAMLLANLGAITFQTGDFETGMKLLSQALAINPNQPIALNNLGNALLERHRFDEALTQFDGAVKCDPHYAEAFSNRGIALLQLNRPEDAIASFDRAIALQPNYADAYSNRALVLKGLRRLEEAAANFECAIALQPEFPEAYSNLGNMLQEMNRLPEAIANYDKALAANPDFAEAYYNRANALRDLKQLEEAVVDYDRAIALLPNYAEAYCNRGLALYDLNRLADALHDFEIAVRLNSNHPEAHCNLGNTQKLLNRLDDAELSLDRAIAMNHDFAEAYWNKALIKLAAGNYRQGWPLYEWRWRLYPPLRKYAKPLWTGKQPLAGKTIFVHAEQGLGDIIQFCRYLPKLADLAGNVFFDAPRPLLDLLTTLQGDVSFIEQGQLPPYEFDYHCPLMSLPLAFDTCLDSIPERQPYLFVNRIKADAWRNILGIKTKPRIGLVWQGGTSTRLKTWASNQRRDIPLRLFAAFRDLALEFYSLQAGEPGRTELQVLITEPWEGPNIKDFTVELIDFSDTAALIDNLDLIITVDTSVVHLAGALGKEVWLLNRLDTCWRWLLDRADSPWYANIKIFRQTEMGNWKTVVDAVKLALIEKFTAFP